jgi:hypothetical protein
MWLPWVYCVFATLAVLVNCLFIISIARTRTKTSTDVLLASLCGGCLITSLGFGIPAVVQLALEFPAWLCWLQAYVRLAGSVHQLTSLCLLGWCSYSACCVQNGRWSASYAGVLLSVFSVLLQMAVAVISSQSTAAAASSSCFFGWTSAATAGLLVPLLVLAYGVSTYFYCAIRNRLEHELQHDRPQTRSILRRNALRTFVNLVGFLSIWAPTFAVFMYIVATNGSNTALDNAVSICLCLNCIWQPHMLNAKEAVEMCLYKRCKCMRACLPPRYELRRLRGHTTVIIVAPPPMSDVPITPSTVSPLPGTTRVQAWPPAAASTARSDGP